VNSNASSPANGNSGASPQHPFDLYIVGLGIVSVRQADIHPGATLYIPPATLAEVKDTELAQLVDSLDHLKSITQHPSCAGPGDDPRARGEIGEGAQP